MGHFAQLANQIISTTRTIYSIGCELSAPAFRFAKKLTDDFHHNFFFGGGGTIVANNILKHKPSSDYSIDVAFIKGRSRAGHSVCSGKGCSSQRWFITGTVTECSWQLGHGSAPHRQAGHCYLAGRSKLSQLISRVRSEENASYQCIFAQPRHPLFALTLKETVCFCNVVNIIIHGLTIYVLFVLQRKRL